MTIQDIALFKSYIESKVLRDIFLRSYRKNAVFAKNPTSVEEFLVKTDPDKVIKDAIKSYTINGVYGHDFWSNANDDWLAFLKRGRKNNSYTDYHKLMELDGMFKILRENWDSLQAWKYEPVDKALIRLGLKDEEEGVECSEESEVEEDVNTPTSREDFSGVPEYDDDLDFFNINAGSRTKHSKMRRNEMRFSCKAGSYRVTFNQYISKDIKKNGYLYVRLAKNKQGDIVIQLHKQTIDDTPVRISYTNAGNETFNANINSKDLVTKLKTLLNFSENIATLYIEILYQNIEKMNIKITKGQ